MLCTVLSSVVYYINVFILTDHVNHSSFNRLTVASATVNAIQVRRDDDMPRACRINSATPSHSEESERGGDQAVQ
jgi:hypothetical protein